MTNEIDWDNAPEGASHYGNGEFWKQSGEGWEFHSDVGAWILTWRYPLQYEDYQERPQPKPKYEYGVEYQTNGQKPDLPDDVLVDVKLDNGFFRNEWAGERYVGNCRWGEQVTAFRIVDERRKPAETAQESPKPQSPYHRTIIGLDGSKCAVDVYRVLDAFKTDSPALDHAIKKILCPGTRHAKTREQDLKEVIKSIESELLLMEQRNGM